MNRKEYLDSIHMERFLAQITEKFANEVKKLLYCGALDTDQDIPISTLHYVAMENVMSSYGYVKETYKNLKNF